MKKTKLLIFIVAFALLLSIALTGCTFFKVNEDREANQTFATVNYKNWSMTVSQNEVIDLYNNYYAQYVSYGYLDAKSAINYSLESKIQSKLLVMKAMEYLGNTANLSPERKAVVNVSNVKSPLDVLTSNEKAFAIETTNESVQSAIDSYIEAIKTEYFEKAVATTSMENIKKDEEGNYMVEIIELDLTDIDKIIEGQYVETTTPKYLKSEYYVDESLKKENIGVRITYKDNITAIMPLKTSMFGDIGGYSAADKTAFDTAGEQTFKITLPIIEFDADNQKVTTDTEFTHSYKVVELRDKKTVEEEEEKDEVENRYAAEGRAVTPYDFNKTPENAIEKEAIRRLKSSFGSSFKDYDYFYNSTVESTILSTVQFEIKNKAEKEFVVSENSIEKRYELLLEKDIDLMGDNINDFATAIGNGKILAYPNYENLNDFVYVSQFLVNFSDDVKDFINANKVGEDVSLETYQFASKSMKVNISNPDYDMEYVGENPEVNNPIFTEKDVYLFKDVYVDAAGKEYDMAGEGRTLKKSLYNRINEELKAADTAEKRLEIFDNWLYKINEDPGIFNNESGYLVAPEGVDNSWVESFTALARQLLVNSKNNVEDTEETELKGWCFDGAENLAYCYTTYGVHFLIIKSLPYEDYAYSPQKAFSEGGTFGLDEVFYGDQTVREYISDLLVEEAKSNAYTAYQAEASKDFKDFAEIEQKKVDKFIEERTEA